MTPTPNAADIADTYMIGEPCSMRTWRTENGRTLYLGEPLCVGCDKPIADGPCDCETPADVAERRAA